MTPEAVELLTTWLDEPGYSVCITHTFLDDYCVCLSQSDLVGIRRDVEGRGYGSTPEDALRAAMDAVRLV